MHQINISGEKDGEKRIGGGDFGSVGVICLANELKGSWCKHVVKAIEIGDKYALQDGKKESQAAEIASGLNIGPILYAVLAFKQTKESSFSSYLPDLTPMSKNISNLVTKILTNARIKYYP